ncbi:MAG: alkaline phosphatase family protein [Bacteroidetes bacterium]|nr:MAG: alkaline phosphatase family protein [Bacteroidota bacterium]
MKLVLCFVGLLGAICGTAQSLFKGGPMLGHVDFKAASIWVEMAPGVQTVEVVYATALKRLPVSKTFLLPGGNANTAKLDLDGLQLNQTYQYTITAKLGKITDTRKGTFTTRELWQWRKAPPTFQFLAGSCAYFNEPAVDRPGAPYGKDSSIFETMAKDSASFMVWLGDNWYTREVDFGTPSGLQYRASLTRSYPVLQNFLKAMPHYAIWDDHDYGPNNADMAYPLKEASRGIFERYWCNPSFGENGQGIYTKINWHDVDVFLLDDRWFRSNDALPDSINGTPNAEKQMLGAAQLRWLKNALAASQDDRQISFRIIAMGSQVLNPLSSSDCLQHFPTEYAALMRMIEELKVEGVLFLTGDRHLSEIIEQKRTAAYPLYDITTSPLTAGPTKWQGNQVNNPYRIAGVDGAQSYARFKVSGQGKTRALSVEFVDKQGTTQTRWSILKTALQYPRQTGNTN